MQRSEADKLLNSLLEILADIEHERWSHWQHYMHAQATKQPDGSLLLPAELANKWEKQIKTPYAELSEEEKESDREQVRKYWPVIAAALANRE